MSAPWSAGRLRSWRGGGPDVLFGFMHEDSAPELSLLPAGGVAGCVLSAGDTAFALLRAGAQRVVAADPNPAQHALVRLKLAAAKDDWTFPKAASASGAEVLRSLRAGPWLRQSDVEFWRNPRRGSRPMVAAGLVDARLRFLARWAAPIFLGRGSDSWRWRFAWQALSAILRLIFPAGLRRHLPRDITQRLRLRFERSYQSESAIANPWLHRLLQCDVQESSWWLKGSWPEAGDTAALSLHEGGLEVAESDAPFDFIATSNIFDTTAAEALNPFLQEIRPKMNKGGAVLVRSLFRETNEWPAVPVGWDLDEEASRRCQALDQSPLCRVSLIVRRSE